MSRGLFSALALPLAGVLGYAHTEIMKGDTVNQLFGPKRGFRVRLKFLQGYVAR